jgi:diketogulonate reductase-like aldo/keto reductase
MGTLLTMETTFRTVGTTGVRVTPLCLGAMNFGVNANADHAESIRIIHRALDAGSNFVDTADIYSRGESEEIVGKALADMLDRIVPPGSNVNPADGGRPAPQLEPSALRR